MGRILLELQTETGTEKWTIHKALREDHLCNIASKWVLHSLTEVKKWTQYAICHLLIFFQNLHYSIHPLPFVYFHVSSLSINLTKRKKKKLVAMT